jgi:acetyl-CoA carboxylase carboxyl transferase subunit beta
MLFHRELADNLNVCSNCDHHMAITPRERFAALFDGGMFTEVKVPEPVVDPLHFRDQKKYTDRIKAAQKSSGEKDAMLVAEGEIAAPDRRRRAGFHLHGRFDGHVCRQCHHRCGRTRGETQAAACAFCASGGARMQEGILSLMQMPRTTVAVQMLKEAGLPYIVVLTHPTTGGVTASYAMLGDVQIAEPNAQICFAGRVIEQTIREKLPEGFQRAEYLLDHGMLDRVVHRKAMKDELVTLVRMLTGQPPAIKGDLPAPVEPKAEAAPE